MRRLAGLLCVASLAFAGLLAWAEDAAQPADPRSEIQELQNQLKHLQQRLDELEKKPDGVSLRERVEDIEKKLGDKLIAGYDGKFFVQSPDGENRVNLGGFFHLDGRFPANGSSKSSDAFLFRRARISLDGFVARYWEFKIEADLADKSSGKTYFTDVYVNWHYFEEFQVKAGNFKAPFSLEELTSDNSLRFIERSALNSLVPSRKSGVAIAGKPVPAGVLAYNIGVFSGSQTGSFMTVARLALDFSKQQDLGILQYVSIGGNAVYDHDAGSTVGTSFSTDLRSKFFAYNSGVTSAGGTCLTGGDISFWRGPFGFVAEYMAADQQLRRTGSPDTNVTNDGWYAQASCVLTGEEASVKGVKLVNEFDLSKGTWGAFEIAGRYTRVNIDKNVFARSFADPSKYTDGSDICTGGLNWYLNKYLKLMFEYEHARFDSPLAGGSEAEDGVITRVQLAF